MDWNSSSSSSPAATSGFQNLGSYGQMMHHLLGHSQASACSWEDTSCPQQQSNVCNNMLPTIAQQEPGPTTSCASSMTLHNHHSGGSNLDDSRDAFSSADPNLTVEMYSELHGLLTKTLQTPAAGSSDEHQQQMAMCSSAAGTATAICEDMNITNWAQFQALHGLLSKNLQVTVPVGTDDQQLTIFNNLAGTASNCADEHLRNLWQSQAAVYGKAPGQSMFDRTPTASAGSTIEIAVGPALNTNGRPRARRGSATDPQSVYARHRRERINDRLKILQHLVPNGTKVDIVTMLEEAINYVRFLQLQVRLLSSDELWIYTPTTYNGVDVSMGFHTGLLQNEQS